jgi:hypothetical protein
MILLMSFIETLSFFRRNHTTAMAFSVEPELSPISAALNRCHRRFEPDLQPQWLHRTEFCFYTIVSQRCHRHVEHLYFNGSLTFSLCLRFRCFLFSKYQICIYGFTTRSHLMVLDLKFLWILLVLLFPCL